MPVWLIPALKAVLPYVGTIVSAAAPVFTKKRADAAVEHSTLLQQQITELQAAASENNTHIRGLAEQMQNTVEVLEKGAALAEARHARALMLSALASAASLTALCIALFVLFTR